MTDPEAPFPYNLFQAAAPTAGPAAVPARTVLTIDGVGVGRQSKPTAARVLALITANPGATIRQVALALGFSHATCSYHLQALMRNGLASRVTDGREVRFFPAGQYSVLSHLRVLVADPMKGAVARFVAEHRDALPSMTLNEVARRLGVRFGFLKRTMLQFERIGFVCIERRGAFYVVWPMRDAMSRDVLALLGTR